MPTDVVLLHAFPLNHTMWEPQIAALSTQFRIIAPDIRGFGSAGPPSPWTVEDAANDLELLLKKRNVKECVVVGLSMGGYIALPFCAMFPHRVRRLVLANTRARADNETEKAARTDMIAALGASGVSILLDRMLPRLLGPNPATEVVSRVRAMIATTHPSAAVYALMAIRDRPDASTVLHRLACPTMVIAGEHDVITRVEECREMAASIADSRFVQIPQAGHLSNLENPEEFNRALLEFLEA